MLDIIFQSLIESGLVTTALMLVPALVTLWAASRAEPAPSGRRLLVTTAVGALLGLVALMVLEAKAVQEGEPAWAEWAWLGVALAWVLVATTALPRVGRAAIAGVAIAGLGYLIHAYVTTALLFG